MTTSYFSAKSFSQTCGKKVVKAVLELKIQLSPLLPPSE
jgi:hypothetical protein